MRKMFCLLTIASFMLVAGCTPADSVKKKGTDPTQVALQEGQLFKTADLKDLSADQTKQYERIKKSPATIDGTITVLKMSDTLPAKGTKVNLNFTVKDQKISMTDCIVSESGKIIQYNDKANENTATITMSEKAATGLVYYDKKVYSIEPLGGSYVAITQIDQTKFPKDQQPKN